MKWLRLSPKKDVLFFVRFLKGDLRFMGARGA